MARYSVSGGGYRHDVLELKPFKTHGAMEGTADNFSRYSTGQLRAGALRQWREDFDNPTTRPDYVIFSYATPIAWHTPGIGWRKVITSFSVTTSKHQSALYFLPNATPVGLNLSYHTKAQRALLYKLAQEAKVTPIPTFLTPGEVRSAKILEQHGLMRRVTHRIYALTDYAARQLADA